MAYIEVSQLANGLLSDHTALIPINPKIGTTEALKMFMPKSNTAIIRVILFNDRVVVEFNNAQSFVLKPSLSSVEDEYPISSIGGVAINMAGTYEEGVEDMFNKLIAIL